MCFLTSSRVNNPFPLMALTMVPLVTPLQPQTFCRIGHQRGFVLPLVTRRRPAVWPKIRWSRRSWMSRSS